MVVEIIWKPLSLSELTPVVFNKGLAYLGSEASSSYYELLTAHYVKQRIVNKRMFFYTTLQFSCQ